MGRRWTNSSACLFPRWSRHSPFCWRVKSKELICPVLGMSSNVRSVGPRNVIIGVVTPRRSTKLSGSSILPGCPQVVQGNKRMVEIEAIIHLCMFVRI